MSVTVTFTETFATFEQAQDFLASITRPVEGPMVPKPQAEKPAPATTVKQKEASAPTPPTAAAEPVAAPEKKAAPSAPLVEYPVLQKAVFELAGLAKKAGLDSGEHVLSIARKHGGSTFKEVPADAWAAALADVRTKIEAINAEAQVA